MKTNKAAVKVLTENGWSSCHSIVRDLIEAGIIEEDVMTEPERIAQAAKIWLGSNHTSESVFEHASGWSTASWAYVLNEPYEGGLDHDCKRIKDIFLAIVILAKEAGVEL